MKHILLLPSIIKKRYKDKKKRLVNKSNISDLVKNSDLNTKLAALTTKAN